MNGKRGFTRNISKRGSFEMASLVMNRSRLPALLTILVSLLAACSAHQLSHVIASKDPKAAAKAILEQKKYAYKHNPLTLVQDVKRSRYQFNQLVALFSGNVNKSWGKKEVILPSRHQYVKYTQNYKSRAIVNFDSGIITVETLDKKAPTTSLKNAIVTTLLTPDDPRSVDLYSAKTIKLTGKPYLYTLVVDHRGKAVGSPSQAGAYANYLLSNKRYQRVTKPPGKRKRVNYVKFRMVSDHSHRQSQRYAPYIKQYSRHFGISRSLVYATIKTESNFNPFAVSRAPAYGLMQLVPTSGGRDAYRKVKGKNGIPSRQYLFNARNNIELGTAYMHIINYEYLGGIRDPVSREYCAIAAYNTGSGNVLRAFNHDRREAVHIINRLSPSAVYKRLRSHLAHAEARRYLIKVINARKAFINI